MPHPKRKRFTTDSQQPCQQPTIHLRHTPHPTPPPADGEVHDSVKLHNSRANMRGCSFFDEAEAKLAAAAAAAAKAPCKGPGSCAPVLRRAGTDQENAAAQA